jgi:hypothetical protein
MYFLRWARFNQIYFKQMKTTLKSIILLGVIFVASCNKEKAPQNAGQKTPVQIKTIQSEPGGDDDDDYIIIRGRTVYLSGDPVPGAQIHIFNQGFSLYDTTGLDGYAEMSVPDTGVYQYDIVYDNEPVVNSSVHLTLPLTYRTDTL